MLGNCHWNLTPKCILTSYSHLQNCNYFKTKKKTLAFIWSACIEHHFNFCIAPLWHVENRETIAGRVIFLEQPICLFCWVWRHLKVLWAFPKKNCFWCKDLSGEGARVEDGHVRVVEGEEGVGGLGQSQNWNWSKLTKKRRVVQMEEFQKICWQSGIAKQPTVANYIGDIGRQSGCMRDKSRAKGPVPVPVQISFSRDKFSPAPLLWSMDRRVFQIDLKIGSTRIHSMWTSLYFSLTLKMST